MEGSHFFLTLPSDSSLDIYPDNTLSEFTVNLPQPMELEGEWEVCLNEIQYPRTWNNVRHIQNHFYIRDPSGIPSVYILEAGYYPTVEDIIQGIKSSIDDKTHYDNVDLTYNKITRRVTVEIKNGYSMIFGDGLASIFGFGLLQYPKLEKKTTAPNVVNLEGALHSLFVYSDVIEAQVVGNSMVPLLRILNVEGRDGETISKTFLNPPYFPVSRKTIDRIEVNIKDDTGEKVPFESGKVIIQLHFRQRRPLYL